MIRLYFSLVICSLLLLHIHPANAEIEGTIFLRGEGEAIGNARVFIFDAHEGDQFLGGYITDVKGTISLSPLSAIFEQKGMRMTSQITVVIPSVLDYSTTVKKDLSLREYIRIELVKTPLTKEGARLLKYEGKVTDSENNPLHDVHIFLIGSNSQDSSQAGVIQFIPYIDKTQRSFQILLAKEGYQPRIESVSVPEDVKEEEWYSLSEKPYVLLRDALTPITVGLMPASITSPIIKSGIKFYSKAENFNFFLTLNAQNGIEYYASKVLQDIPPAGAKITTQISATKPEMAGWKESKLPDGGPPFYLSPASIENSLVVEPASPVNPTPVNMPQKETAFWVKLAIPSIVFIIVLILACVVLVSVKKAAKAREAESRILQKSGIPWDGELIKKARKFMKGLGDDKQESFRQAIELAENLAEQGKELGTQIELYSKALKKLKEQRKKVINNMRQFMDDKNFIEAKFVAETIQKIEVLQHEKQNELNEIKTALSKNNLSLKSVNNALSSMIERTQATLTRQEIEEAIRNIQGQHHLQSLQVISQNLKGESLMEEADYQNLLEEARKELSEEIAGEIRVEELSQFLKERKK